MYEKPFSYSPPAYVPNDPSLRRNEYDGEGDYDYGMLGNIASGVGNLVDLPGSMVRDAISFSNPFDQLMTPLSSDNRTSGAEISRYWMGGDEDSGGNQMAGMVIDILTDPLMLASGGTMAAGRMGAKAAGSAVRGAKGVGKAAKAAAVQAGTKQARRQLPGIVSANKSAADNLAAQQAYSPFGQYYKQGVMDDLTNSPSREMIQGAMASLPRSQQMLNRAESLGAGAMAGGRQLAESVSGGVSDVVRGGLRGGRNLASDALSGNRNAMMQAGAIGTNAASAMGGLNMSQEPSIEEMIASAIMEDPELGSQLLELLMAGQAQY